MELAEHPANLGALLVGITSAGFQMSRGLKVVSNVTVSETSETVLPIQDGPEQFVIGTSQGLKPEQNLPAASFFRVVMRSRSRLASVGTSTAARAFRYCALASIDQRSCAESTAGPTTLIDGCIGYHAANEQIGI